MLFSPFKPESIYLPDNVPCPPISFPCPHYALMPLGVVAGYSKSGARKGSCQIGSPVGRFGKWGRYRDTYLVVRCSKFEDPLMCGSVLIPTIYSHYFEVPQHQQESSKLFLAVVLALRHTSAKLAALTPSQRISLTIREIDCLWILIRDRFRAHVSGIAF